MKITMRFSIASIVLFLLTITSTLIIWVGSFALRTLLITAASSTMSYESKKACQQINNYFSPLTHIRDQAAEMFNYNIIKPKYSEKMMDFMHAVVISTDLSGVFWWDPDEDFFYVDQPTETNDIEDIIIFGKKHGNKTIQKFYDNNLKLLKIETLDKAANYKKPWCQLAITKKQTVTIIFYFANLGSQKKQLGIVVATPFYDHNKNLLGIFGADMLFSKISNYINNIHITKNSSVFIINGLGQTLDSFYNDKDHTNTIESDLALKRKSFTIYNKEHQTPFVFKFNGKKYISTYEQIFESGCDVYLISAQSTNKDIIDLLTNKPNAAYVIAGNAIYTIKYGLLKKADGGTWLKGIVKNQKPNIHIPIQLTDTEKETITSNTGYISGLQTKNAWFVSVITPMNDVIGPLHKQILIELLMILAVIPIGFILTSIFSTSLSRPIKKLAQNANLICELKLNEVSTAFSRIKEIAEMNDSFVRMKQAIASFQRYIPVALVKKLIASNSTVAIGGENKELTLMFTDIENFTALSEHIEPQELLKYLSEYFQIITKIIIDTHGTVDKYIGDSVMAFWGAPIEDNNHALHACQAAIKIQEALKQFNQKNQEIGNPVLLTRIGINTGTVVVGNVGSDDRLNYTSLGDHVNLTSRLEGLNKTYGTYTLVSENTYNKVKDNFKFKFKLIDKVVVRGKTQALYVYELN